MRVPYKAPEERNGVCFGGLRLRSMWKNNGLEAVVAPFIQLHIGPSHHVKIKKAFC
jgi:hypothetical protein